MNARISLAGLAIGWLVALLLTAVVPAYNARAAVPAYPAAAVCHRPHVVPWRFSPDTVAYLRPRVGSWHTGTVTELDLWSTDGRTHLRQSRDPYSDGWAFGTFAFHARAYAAGWDIVNDDLYNYGARAVCAYGWHS